MRGADRMRLLKDAPGGSRPRLTGMRSGDCDRTRFAHPRKPNQVGHVEYYERLQEMAVSATQLGNTNAL